MLCCPKSTWNSTCYVQELSPNLKSILFIQSNFTNQKFNSRDFTTCIHSFSQYRIPLILFFLWFLMQCVCVCPCVCMRVCVCSMPVCVDSVSAVSNTKGHLHRFNTGTYWCLCRILISLATASLR